jgi:hypothetical protein
LISLRDTDENGESFKIISKNGANIFMPQIALKENKNGLPVLLPSGRRKLQRAGASCSGANTSRRKLLLGCEAASIRSLQSFHGSFDCFVLDFLGETQGNAWLPKAK